MAFATRSIRARSSERSEEHMSELQSQFHLVCRLLLEKKKPCPKLSSTKKLPGGNHASVQTKKSASCRPRLLKTTPASGNAPSPLSLVLLHHPPRATLFPYTTLFR